MGSNLWCSAFKSQSCSDLCGFVEVFVFFLPLHSFAFFFFLVYYLVVGWIWNVGEVVIFVGI